MGLRQWAQDAQKAAQHCIPACHAQCAGMPAHSAAPLALAALAGARQFTFHIEAPGIDFSCGAAAALAARARALGMLAGIALKPETPVDAILPLLSTGRVDTVLLLAVRAGFGGQKFNPAVLPKVAAVRAAFAGNIIVDGGITLGEAGLSCIVCGSPGRYRAFDGEYARCATSGICHPGPRTSARPRMLR